MINLPPDPDIGAGESISGSTQLNVSDGGIVASRFNANSGSEVNISGGDVRDGFTAFDSGMPTGFLGFT